jgi:hypothetical protein
MYLGRQLVESAFPVSIDAHIRHAGEVGKGTEREVLMLHPAAPYGTCLETALISNNPKDCARWLVFVFPSKPCLARGFVRT